MGKSRSFEHKHILCLRFSAFGDVAMTAVVLRAYAADNPSVRFTLAGPARLAPLFNGPSNLALFPINKKEGVRAIYASLKSLQTPTYVVDLHSVLRTLLLRTRFWLTGIPVAYLHKGRVARRRLLRHKDGASPMASMFQRYDDTLRRAGLCSRFVASAASFWNAPNRVKCVGIAPFARHEGKQWPIAYMEEVVAWLSRQGYRVLLFGGGPQEEARLALWARTYEHVENKAGLPFEKELEAIQTVALMVTMDSANMHFASWAHVPVVSIWGATHPSAGFYGWRQDPSWAVQADMPCRPCSIFGNKPCAQGTYACLRALKPAAVIQQLECLCTTK